MPEGENGGLIDGEKGSSWGYGSYFLLNKQLKFSAEDFEITLSSNHISMLSVYPACPRKEQETQEGASCFFLGSDERLN